MLRLEFISLSETLLFNAGQQRIRGGKRMFENALSSAVTIALFVFGVSIAFILFSAYLWSRERKRILLD